jgi:zinc protease
MSVFESTPIPEVGAIVHDTRLANGLRLLVVERHTDPVVASMCWYRVGSKSEHTEEAGMSHFLEHMMFKGTPKFGKGMVDREITQLGGSNNAYTSYDFTAYWFELASDRWERALDLEADRMPNLLLDPEEFESEKAVVLEELSMGLDDPWRRLSQELAPLLHGRHPYGRPIIGYRDVLGRMTPEMMRTFYKRFYHPGNATVVISGDVSPERALEMVEAKYGSIPAGTPWSDADTWRPEMEVPLGSQRLDLTWDDPGQRIIMAWPTAKVGTDADFASDVLSTLITTGRLSRMYRSLVLDKGLATFVSAHNDARQEGGSFHLYAEANHGVEAARLEEALRQEIKQLHETVPTQAELERAQNILAAGERSTTETVSGLAEHLGEYAIDADWPLGFELTERRQKISAQDLKNFASEYLTEERCITGTSLPAKD